METDLLKFIEILRKQEQSIEAMQECKTLIIKEFITECRKRDMTDDDIVRKVSDCFLAGTRLTHKLVYDVGNNLYGSAAPTVKPHIVDKVLGNI